MHTHTHTTNERLTRFISWVTHEILLTMMTITLRGGNQQSKSLGWNDYLLIFRLLFSLTDDQINVRELIARLDYFSHPTAYVTRNKEKPFAVHLYPPNHHRLKKKTCKNSLDRRWCGDTRLCLASLICVWVSCCSPGWTFIAGPILIVTVDDYFFLPEMPLSLWTLVDI